MYDGPSDGVKKVKQGSEIDNITNIGKKHTKLTKEQKSQSHFIHTILRSQVYIGQSVKGHRTFHISCTG